MSFSEEKLEQAVIDFFKAEGYEHVIGENIHRELPDVLLRTGALTIDKNCAPQPSCCVIV
jgi:hypothetical protein